MVVPRSGTLMRFFLAASMPFLIAEGTSFALPTPKPTTPWPSPTTTRALKLRFLPPLTTFVTRLIETTVSLMSSCEGSMRSLVLMYPPGAPAPRLELQPGFPRRVRYGPNAAVVQKPAPVEDDPLDALVDRPLGDRLADRLGALDVAAAHPFGERSFERLIDARSRYQRLAAQI